MKHLEPIDLLSAGAFPKSSAWAKAQRDINAAIEAIVWPQGSQHFTIKPDVGKKSGQGNGVVPIKKGLQEKLSALGWELEKSLNIANGRRCGKIDAVKLCNESYVCLEFETGNISSAHRSLNKLKLGLMKGIIKAGVLAVPTRALYRYLTDRVANFEELEAYLDVWRDPKGLIADGILQIIPIEHDDIDENAPRIAKGTDGRALI